MEFKRENLWTAGGLRVSNRGVEEYVIHDAGSRRGPESLYLNTDIYVLSCGAKTNLDPRKILFLWLGSMVEDGLSFKTGGT